MKTHAKNVVPLLFFLLFIITLLTGCEKDDETTGAPSVSVQEIVEEHKDGFNEGGIVAMVRESNGTAHYGVFGKSEPGVALSKDMSFAIGSDTKTFTAVLIFLLIEEKMLHLSDRLGDIVPEAVNENISGDITIQQLLTHSTGLFDPINGTLDLINNVAANPSYEYSVPEILALVTAPLFEPGAMHSYCNINYTLLGLVIEEKTGKPYHQHLRETILTPLGLSQTWVNGKEEPVNTLAYSWNNHTSRKDNDLSGMESIAWAAGSIFTTVDDMAKWYRALFNGEVISEVSLQQMLSATPGVGDINYGSGMFSETYNGVDLYAHGGSRMGYYTLTVYNTDTEAISVIFTNERKFEYAEDGSLIGADTFTEGAVFTLRNDLLDAFSH